MLFKNEMPVHYIKLKISPINKILERDYKVLTTKKKLTMQDLEFDLTEFVKVKELF